MTVCVRFFWSVAFHKVFYGGLTEGGHSPVSPLAACRSVSHILHRKGTPLDIQGCSHVFTAPSPFLLPLASHLCAYPALHQAAACA